MSEKFELSRRKALAGLATIGAAGAGAGLGTSALFSDTESFEENTITAGTTNLIVEAKLAAVSQGLSENGSVTLESAGDDGVATADGEAQVGLSVSDVKPGDSFVLGFDVTVEDNPMYVQLGADDLDDDEGTNTEPEMSASEDPDQGNDGIGDGDGNDAGDLDNQAVAVVGYDSSPNDFTWDGATSPPEPPANTELGGEQSLNTLLTDLASSGFLYRDGEEGAGVPQGHGLAAPTELGGGDNVTHWVYVEVPIDVGNEIQGDTLSFDLVWSAEQVRNNDSPFDGQQDAGS